MKMAAWKMKLNYCFLDTSDAEIPDDLEEGTEFLDGTGKQLEAQMVAKRIKELVGKTRVKDKETGEYRPAQYRDIVILSRSAKGGRMYFQRY